MKKKIFLFFTLVLPLIVLSQTLYYQANQVIVVNPNFSFSCVNDDGQVTLSATTDIYTNAEWTRKDGSPLPLNIHQGYVKTLSISDAMLTQAKKIVNDSFTTAQKALIKNEYLQVTLIINPENGKVWEVNFNFDDDSKLCQIPAEVFYNILISLKNNIQVQMTKEGKDLNYGIFGWMHKF